MYKIKMTQEFGRGLYATRKIYQGELITVCELLVLSEIDTPIVNSTDLKYYTFKYNDKQDCLVMGIGEMFNHSDSPNVSFRLETWIDRKVMVFQAVSDIDTNCQLFIDYNSDIKVDLSKYTVNLQGEK